MKAYHYSPSGNRKSILALGLLTRSPGQNRSLAEADGFRAGVYMFVDSRQAFLLDDGDVFEVDLTDVIVEPDPFHLDIRALRSLLTSRYRQTAFDGSGMQGYRASRVTERAPLLAEQPRAAAACPRSRRLAPGRFGSHTA